MSEFPARVRLSRAKGFRLQEHAPGAIVVRRPTKWGNPFTVADALAGDPTLTLTEVRRRCVEHFELWLDGEIERLAHVEQRAWILHHLDYLTGRPLACTCPLPGSGEIDWCHARVLIERSNEPAGTIPPLTTAWASVHAPGPVPIRPRETVRLSRDLAHLL